MIVLSLLIYTSRRKGGSGLSEAEKKKLVIKDPINPSALMAGIFVTILGVVLLFDILPLYVSSELLEYFMIFSVFMVAIFLFWLYHKDSQKEYHFYPGKLEIRGGVRENKLYILKNIKRIEPDNLTKKYMGCFDYRVYLRDGGKSENIFLKKEDVKRVKNLNEDWDEKLVFHEKFMD